MTAIKISSYPIKLRVQPNARGNGAQIDVCVGKWEMKGVEIYNHSTGQEQLGVQVDIFEEVMEGEGEGEQDYTYKL